MYHYTYSSIVVLTLCLIVEKVNLFYYTKQKVEKVNLFLLLIINKVPMYSQPKIFCRVRLPPTAGGYEISRDFLVEKSLTFIKSNS